ncbi:NCS1 family transporter [Gilliamella sp. B3791]|uniref:NCS1 family transporter n=1 Tax=unclassified Gilliamella TaxID=2685620 RepID=UPI00226A58B2|nr:MULTISPECIES: NCS1 family transporter [unclassified Gilliamella]MCX8642652.1 NCS1 family transporter [Gilliamella sp. B3835]MCX8708118.1 NCS1 family transporter [Gilliamella sp. B3783]MCX8709670.1 NCS1 family transporter [Gilliamella sp. B3780]MCX8712993.1 NCS1 family transporter [Gilliamella sp. B3468]MCX8717313.1 NCS1 family transporter [Gilliamella sp. B3784]
MNNNRPQLSNNQLNIDKSLLPKTPQQRTVNPLAYAFMWIGDGVNLGNMTLGASLVVAGFATMNIVQTFMAALIAILIITSIFVLNDRLGYRTGIPYVVQLRMSFGIKGSIISSLLRGIPGIVWYGFQSWIGGTALNEIIKILSNESFDNVFICFVVLQFIQIGLSLYGFHAIKWVEILISLVILSALVYAFILLLRNHQTVIIEKWINTQGTWGLPFFGFIMMFLGNYAAIFLSAADYSRELKSGISNGKRGLLYFVPITIAYGFVITIGAMLASVTGNSNPVKAFAIVVDNSYITVAVSSFIVLGAIAVNMVANIIPPAYVISLLTKVKYKSAVTITGLLAIASFPWILVQDSSAKGLGLFILIYSAFLGPIVAILLVEYYLLRRQQVDINELYNKNGQFAGFNKAAILAMFIGSAAAFCEVSLSWLIGFFVGGLSYILLTKYAFKQSPFRKGTIFEKSNK